MRIGGVFNGTAADVTLCIGFVPDYVELWNLEVAGSVVSVEWNKGLQRASEVVEGIQYSVLDQVAAALTKGGGILAYRGGVLLTSSDVGTTTYGEGVYLKPDKHDYRRVNDDATGILGDAATVVIDTWTLSSASTYKGKFNGDVTGTYIGEGSSININGRTYSIVDLDAGEGVADSEVTLSHNVSDGPIYAIHGKYDYKPMVAGEVTKDGFTISNTTINANDELVAFEAGKYDR